MLFCLMCTVSYLSVASFGLSPFSIFVDINYLKIYTSPRRLSGDRKMMVYLVPAVQQQDLLTCVAGIVIVGMDD